MKPQANYKKHGVNSPLDVIRVQIGNEVNFMTREVYMDEVMTMSTGDFHVHEARIAFEGETEKVLYKTETGEVEPYPVEFFYVYKAPKAKLTVIKGGVI